MVLCWTPLETAVPCSLLPHSHSRGGTAHSVTWSNHLHIFSGCFTEVFLNLLRAPPPKHLGSTLLSPILTKEFIQGSTENTLWCSSQFPTEKSSWNRSPQWDWKRRGQLWCLYGDEGNPTMVEMAETVHYRPRRYGRVLGGLWHSQTELASSWEVWVFFPWYTPKRGGPSQHVPIFRTLMITMRSLPVTSITST